MKTAEEIASEQTGKKLELFTDTEDLIHITPFITPKQCLRAMEAYHASQLKQGININDKVSVKLTRYGFDLFLRLDTDGNLYKYNYDAVSNTLTTELWQIMNLFGSFIYNGCQQVFEHNEITIEYEQT